MDRSARLEHRQAVARTPSSPHAGREQANLARAASDGVLFDTTRYRGAGDVLEQVAALRASGATTTGFQTEPWLAALFQEVAPHAAGEPNLVVVRRRSSGAPVLALPLVVRTSGAFRSAEFADCGLSDYCAPLLGPDPPKTRDEAATLVEALRAALDDVDVIRLEKMPAVIEGRANPLVLPVGAHPSRFSGNRLTVSTTVKDYIASRGKKYRKEAERSRRRLEDEGTVDFSRAATLEEIDCAYRVLEAWQETRHRELGHDYRLDRAEISAFYRNLLIASRDTQLASLFTLKVDHQPVAAVLGITHDKTFTLLRISDAGGAWSHCSPGRMVVIEAMEHLVAKGITIFDMGIGDYPFKRWIGCETYPLCNHLIAVTPRGRIQILADRAGRAIRANRTLLAIARRIKGLAA